jgi:flagellar motor component MotA
MTKTEFNKQYTVFMKETLSLAALARRDGLLSLKADNDKVKERDIFEYGIKLAIDGTAPEIIGIILNNIIVQEKDEYTHLYKVIQMEAVLGIQQGLNSEMLFYMLNSLTDIPLKEDEGYLLAIGSAPDETDPEEQQYEHEEGRYDGET